jgi:uncharacterized phage protein gp47/JayE
MTLEAGQLYIPETAQEILDDYLMDFSLECRKFGITDPATQPGTENWFFFKAMANGGLLQYANIGTIRPALTPLTAEGADLEAWRIALDLPVVEPSPAAGKITVKVADGQTITVPNGQRFTLPNGLRGHVSGTHPAVADGSDVSVVMDDPGEASNAKADTKVRFSNAPFGLDTEARVSRASPLTGGFDEETEARKRERVLNRLGTSAGGGNWGQHRETAFNALATVQDCFVYPALGGPSGEKVVIVRPFDIERNDFHRIAADAAVEIVRNAIHKTNSGSNTIVVDTVGEESADVGLFLELPDSSLAGGNGTGWVDQQPWPCPALGHDNVVTVTAVTSTTAITVGPVSDATVVVAGLTSIAWWAPGDQSFHVALVLTAEQDGAEWEITLDAPLVDEDGGSVAVGDFVSPPAVNRSGYRATFLKLMGELGAGENVAPGAPDTPRRLRHPDTSEGAQMALTSQFLGAFGRRHPEIDDLSFAHAEPDAPTVPASVEDRPNILVPRHFGIYPTP